MYNLLPWRDFLCVLVTIYLFIIVISRYKDLELMTYIFTPTLFQILKNYDGKKRPCTNMQLLCIMDFWDEVFCLFVLCKHEDMFGDVWSWFIEYIIKFHVFLDILVYMPN